MTLTSSPLALILAAAAMLTLWLPTLAEPAPTAAPATFAALA